jgi:hypothetical protein
MRRAARIPDFAVPPSRRVIMRMGIRRAGNASSSAATFDTESAIFNCA